MKTIQQVPLKDGESIFILDYNEQNSELTFRTSRVPEHKQTEKVKIINDKVYTYLYNFHISFIEQFINLNNQLCKD